MFLLREMDCCVSWFFFLLKELVGLLKVEVDCGVVCFLELIIWFSVVGVVRVGLVVVVVVRGVSVKLEFVLFGLLVGYDVVF